MAYANNDFIWTPDESTPYDYTANLANMASSIEEVVGRHVYEATSTATPTNTANFGPYTAGNVIRLERNGPFVTVSGTWSCNTANYIVGTTSRQFASIPVGFRPKQRVPVVMQGSGTVHWYLEITSAGALNASRATGNTAAGFWMPFSVTYLAED